MNSARTMPCVLVLPPRSKPPGFHRPRICCLEAGDDRVDELLFAGQRLFLRERELLVDALGVDQEGDEARQRIAQHGVERRPEERIEAALEAG